MPGFHAAPSGDLSRPQLNARSQIQSMFFAFAEFYYSYEMPKAVRNNGGGRQGGQGRNRRKAARTEEAHSQGDVTEYTLEERKKYLLLR